MTLIRLAGVLQLVVAGANLPLPGCCASEGARALSPDRPPDPQVHTAYLGMLGFFAAVSLFFARN